MLLATIWILSKKLPEKNPSVHSVQSTNIIVQPDAPPEDIVDVVSKPQKKHPSNPTDPKPSVVAVQSATATPLPRVPSTESNSLLSAKRGDDSGETLMDESWILRLDPSSHIIQIGASTDLSALEKFLPAKNTGNPIAIYPYARTLSGKNVYGIATGVYESNEAASLAAANISAQTKSYQPWIRQVAHLAVEINKVKSQQH